MAKFVSRRDLEGAIGADRVVQLHDDDHDGKLNDAEVALLNETLAIADDLVTGALLNKGWGADGVNALSEDRVLRRCACQIAAQVAGERRAEFADGEGNGPYSAQGKRAMDMLKAYSRGTQRSRLENVAGTNAAIRGRWNSTTPRRIFGRDPSDPEDQLGDNKGF